MLPVMEAALPAMLPVTCVPLILPVMLVALPLRVAVIVPAVKLPEASRFTKALAVLASVAPLAASVALATLAAVLVPTSETTVLDCVPVTSPARLPVKLLGAAAPMSVQFAPSESCKVLVVVLRMIIPLLAGAAAGLPAVVYWLTLLARSARETEPVIFVPAKEVMNEGSA